MHIVFNEFRDRFSCFLIALGTVFSGFFSLENKLENEGIFCDVTDPEYLNWRGNLGVLGPSKDKSIA